MRNTPNSASARRQPPVARYALIVGALIVVGILATLYGQRHQNAVPSPVSSAQPASAGGASAR